MPKNKKEIVKYIKKLIVEYKDRIRACDEIAKASLKNYDDIDFAFSHIIDKIIYKRIVSVLKDILKEAEL